MGKKFIRFFNLMFILSTIVASNAIFAAQNITFGTVASNIANTFSNMGLMLTGLSYVAGLGFAIAAILKFKQHKDNPQQVQVGMPLGLLAVAAGFLFLPTLMGVTGATIFGTAATAGPGGVTIS